MISSDPKDLLFRADVSKIYILEGLNPFPNESTYLQLRYTQTVILNFNEVLWPHVSVATLRPQF